MMSKLIWVVRIEKEYWTLDGGDGESKRLGNIIPEFAYNIMRRAVASDGQGIINRTAPWEYWLFLMLGSQRK